VAQQPLMGQGLLIIDASRSHSDTPQKVGLLWTNGNPTQRPLPDNTHNTHKRQTTIPRRYSNPQSQQVSNRRPIP